MTLIPIPMGKLSERAQHNSKQSCHNKPKFKSRYVIQFYSSWRSRFGASNIFAHARALTLIWGAGGWGSVLLGPMGLWCPARCQKLYGLVGKPLATLLHTPMPH